jgi:serine/threonine protein kinase
VTPDIAQAQQIFAAALAIGNDTERATYLDEACGHDSQLRQRVEAILKAQDGTVSFLPISTSVAVTTSMPPTERAGTTIGPYTLIEKIGEGGFGVVFLAEQREPIRRQVALKLLKLGMDSHDVIARFEAERQALALMDHPNIAKVFDAGATVAGRPYFVMELVKGIPVTKYCDQCSLPTTARLEIFVVICQAVQHAHQKGVIHRDIKPSNVLVAMQDLSPTVKVIDFGVAKAINQRLTEQSIHTGFAQLLGTPLYMSPEQAAMSPLEIDTRGDIYSLGVLLYELLTGTTPFDPERLRSASFDEMRRIIREEEPPLPSARFSTINTDSLSTIAGTRRTEVRRLAQSLRGDLDWIVMKCLEKDRTRRYETAAALAADIQHFLADEPVSAAAPSAIYSFKKFISRNRVAALTSGLIVAALLIGSGVATWQAMVATQARTLAESAQKKTMDALRSATDEVVEKLIGSRESLGPSEREFLESAIARWQEFANLEGDSEFAKSLRADGAYNIANLEARLGRAESAMKHYRVAIQLFYELSRDFRTPDHLCNLAKAHNNLGITLEMLGEQRAALTEYELARGLQLRLVQAHPNHLLYLEDLAKSHNNVAAVIMSEDPNAAGDEFMKARAILIKLDAQDSASGKFTQRLAQNHSNVATVLSRLGKTDLARAELAAAIDLQTKLCEMDRENPEYHYDRAISYMNSGKLELSVRKLNEARDASKNAREDLKQLVEKYPAKSAYRIAFGGNSSNLGALIRESGNSTESLQYFDEAIEKLNAVHEREPLNPKVKLFLRNSHIGRAGAYQVLNRHLDAVLELDRAVELSAPGEKGAVRTVRTTYLARAGKIHDAIAEVNQLSEKSPASADGLYTFARVYSIASLQVEDQREDYASRAMEFLKQAIGAGFPDIEYIETDPDLSALFERKDFKELVAEFEPARSKLDAQPAQ